MFDSLTRRREACCLPVFVSASLLCGLVAGMSSATASAAASSTVPPRPADALTEGDALPRSLTDDEQRYLQTNPLAPPQRAVIPPTGPVHCPAEYEPMQGILVAWEGNTSWKLILAQMARHITTTGDADVYVMCDDATDRDDALTQLGHAGADMARVRTYIVATDTIWIRDYGPRYIVEGGVRAIVDHRYNRPRPRDDDQPFFWRTVWNHALYEIPLTHGGGNFHLDALGKAFTTRLINNENPDKTEQQIHDLWRDFQNLDTTFFNPFDRTVDATQHIDMWMQVIADDAIIISDWPFNDGSSQDRICDRAADDLAARGYRVFRTPARSVSGTHYTYTNVVMCNDVVMIPSYTNNSVRQHNDEALAVYEAALPDKTIVQIDAQAIVTAAGVLHCIVMHMPAPPGGRNPTVYLRNFRGGDVLRGGDSVDVNWISDDDEGVTSVDVLLSTNGGASFDTIVAEDLPPTGAFAWTVPDLPTDQARLRLVVHDADGRTGDDESDADFLICSSDGCPCAGRERIRKIVCRPGPGRYYFRIPLAGGIPGDEYTVSLSSGEQVHGVLNERGKHKARFQDVIEPKGVATAVWGCGATDELAYACS